MKRTAQLRPLASPSAIKRICICCGLHDWRELFPGIVRCMACGYQRMAEQPTACDLHSIYREEYYRGAKYHDYPAEKSIIQMNFRARLAAMERWLRCLPTPPAAASLFEIGSAYGFFLELVQHRFARVAGIDISEEATRHAREQLGLDVRTGDLLDLGLPAESVDLVCLWDTIEHLGTPEEYTAAAYRMLKPGGLTFMTTGDVDSWVARLQKRKWRLYDPPQHVHYFSPHSLGMLLFRQGYQVLGTQTCAFVHSIEQIVHGLGFYNEEPGWMGRCCRQVYPLLPRMIGSIHFAVDLRDIFMIVGQKPLVPTS